MRKLPGVPSLASYSDLGAADIVQLIREHKLSCVEVTTAANNAIATLDGPIHAFAALAGSLALERARELDDLRPESAAYLPLLGVPVAVKDAFDTAELPTEYGSPIYHGYRPRADAALVGLLRAAGAIIVGKAKTCEFTCMHPTDTRNPLDLARTPGGSSSGSAAAVADSMVPLALGTQTGGSVIRPAAFCGVIGFKPSFGAINRTGVKPVSDSLDTVGVFANSIDDAARALHALSGIALPDPASGITAPRIGFARTSRWAEADAAAHAALEDAARRFAAAGAIVAEIALPPAVEALFVEQGNVMRYEAARALAWELDNHPEALSASLRERLASGWAISRAQYERARQTAHDARLQFADQMRSFDLVLTLAAPGEAPKGLAWTGDAKFNGLWTMLGVPCITLPWSRGPAGLPVGVQLVGAFGADATVLARAKWACAASAN